MMSRKASRNPKLYVSALIATSAIALTYKLYSTYLAPTPTPTNKDKKQRELDGSSTDIELKPKFRISKRYSNKSIAITLSSTFLSSNLPLNEILINLENMIFIIPPNLNEDDLPIIETKDTDTDNANTNTNTSFYKDQSNFKLLKCSNFQGYLQILKNLKPDLLLLCSDDLGINFKKLQSDLLNNLKLDFINIDQNIDALIQLESIFD
ncbi:Peroxisomal biogenesis protein family [Chlamydia trachomatis]|nr:Peroxisomal biogenesis protein family [Chlamydia trachomatis]